MSELGFKVLTVKPRFLAVRDDRGKLLATEELVHRLWTEPGADGWVIPIIMRDIDLEQQKLTEMKRPIMVEFFAWETTGFAITSIKIPEEH